MADPFPDGTRWHVLYTIPPSKLKLDGFLTLRYMPGHVAKQIFLSDADGSKHLAKRLLGKFEPFPVDEALQIEHYAFEMGAVIEDNFRRPSSIPLPPRSSNPARTSSSLALPRPTDRDSIAKVGTEWNVTYSRNSTKKVKTILEGFVRLVQKNGSQQKVVLRDDQGKDIDELFLGGRVEIRSGMTLKFGNFDVKVDDIKQDSSSPAEILVIKDSPINQKRLPRQPLKSSFEGKAKNRVSPQDHVEREIEGIIEDSGTRRIRAVSKTCGKQDIQPKRRDIAQIIECCKRPLNSFSRESSSTANSCSREPAGREGTSMLSSTSGRRCEDERSATLDCVDRIQKLNVGRACPEPYDDDCFYIEHDLIQQENILVKSRPDLVINLDDQFDVVVEQHEMSVEKIESDASLHTRREFTKCSEEVKLILDDRRFRVRDFWEGYKLYCFGYYSHCSRSKEQFLASKMGRVVCLLHTEKDVRWGSKFDETVREVWAMMEEYVEVYHGKDCTNLRALMEEFEDEKKLSSSENGSLLLQLIKDDEHGTERLYRHSGNIQIQTTNIFDQFRSRLQEVDSNLDSLVKSSGKSSENSSEIYSDLDNSNLVSRNSYEVGSVGNAVKFSAGSRNKSKGWSKNTMPSFDLGI